MIAYAKDNRKIKHGFRRTGSAPHMAAIVQRHGRVNMVHIPYRARPARRTARRQVQILFAAAPWDPDYIRSG